MMKKKTIWTNQIDTSDKNIRRYRQEICDDTLRRSDDQIITRMYEENAIWLGDEKLNLDLPTANPILVAADMDMWGLGYFDYWLLASNVSEIFGVSYGGCTYIYADANDIHCQDLCSSGTNRYLFRELVGNENECKPLLDVICYQCHYSTSEGPVKDGFGCLHPEADEAETDPNTGLTVGRCWNSGCPLVCALDDEDLRSPDLDRNGHRRDDLTDTDGKVLDDGQFATIRCDESASPDEKKLLYHYRRYMHRYDKDWLEKHREEH